MEKKTITHFLCDCYALSKTKRRIVETDFIVEQPKVSIRNNSKGLPVIRVDSPPQEQ